MPAGQSWARNRWCPQAEINSNKDKIEGFATSSRRDNCGHVWKCTRFHSGPTIEEKKTVPLVLVQQLCWSTSFNINWPKNPDAEAFFKLFMRKLFRLSRIRKTCPQDTFQKLCSSTLKKVSSGFPAPLHRTHRDALLVLVRHGGRGGRARLVGVRLERDLEGPGLRWRDRERERMRKLESRRGAAFRHSRPSFSSPYCRRKRR